MRSFPVPMDLYEEEKIFGGVLSARQMAYLVGFGMLGCLAGFAPSFLPVFIRAVLSVPVVLGGPVFAFYEPYGLRLDRYIGLWLGWRSGPRRFHLKGV